VREACDTLNGVLELRKPHIAVAEKEATDAGVLMRELPAMYVCVRCGAHMLGFARRRWDIDRAMRRSGLTELETLSVALLVAEAWADQSEPPPRLDAIDARRLADPTTRSVAAQDARDPRQRQRSWRTPHAIEAGPDGIRVTDLAPTKNTASSAAARPDLELLARDRAASLRAAPHGHVDLGTEPGFRCCVRAGRPWCCSRATMRLTRRATSNGRTPRCAMIEEIVAHRVKSVSSRGEGCAVREKCARAILSHMNPDFEMQIAEEEELVTRLRADVARFGGSGHAWFELSRSESAALDFRKALVAAGVEASTDARGSQFVRVLVNPGNTRLIASRAIADHATHCLPQLFRL